jgi:hypothetical protein
MSKKRKTKKEKIIAAGRHDFLSIVSAPEIPEIIDSHSPKEDFLRKSSGSYTHVINDVRKTFSIITSIIILNIILFFLLKFKFISLPGIGY